MRSAECGIAARPSLRYSTFHFHSAFRIPHSALVLSRPPQLSHHHPFVEPLLFGPDDLIGLVPLPASSRGSPARASSRPKAIAPPRTTPPWGGLAPHPPPTAA